MRNLDRISSARDSLEESKRRCPGIRIWIKENALEEAIEVALNKFLFGLIISGSLHLAVPGHQQMKCCTIMILFEFHATITIFYYMIISKPSLLLQFLASFCAGVFSTSVSCNLL